MKNMSMPPIEATEGPTQNLPNQPLSAKQIGIQEGRIKQRGQNYSLDNNGYNSYGEQGGPLHGPLQPAYDPRTANGQLDAQKGPQFDGPRNRRPPEFMTRPPLIPGVPRGLEYLTQIDQVLIHQQVELFEMMTGLETCNKYQIKNTLGQQVYFAGEESDSLQRQCCGPQRGFTMHIADNTGEEVIRVSRLFKCLAGWNCCAFCSCCAMEIHVEAPVGQVIGYVRQLPSCLVPRFAILDAQQQPILFIEGPAFACRCCLPDQEFKVVADTGQSVGRILKQWGGFAKEYFTDADNFSLEFPMDMDVRIKAVLIAGVFLVDFMFFENNSGNTST